MVTANSLPPETEHSEPTVTSLGSSKKGTLPLRTPLQCAWRCCPTALSRSTLPLSGSMSVARNESGLRKDFSRNQGIIHEIPKWKWKSHDELTSKMIEKRDVAWFFGVAHLLLHSYINDEACMSLRSFRSSSDRPLLTRGSYPRKKNQEDDAEWFHRKLNLLDGCLMVVWWLLILRQIQSPQMSGFPARNIWNKDPAFFGWFFWWIIFPPACPFFVGLRPGPFYFLGGG